MTEKFLTVAWPTLCDECGTELAKKAHGRPDLDVLTTWCPHTQTFAMAYVGDVEGKRAIFKWDVTGPVPEAEALEMIRNLGAASASIENLDSARLH